MTEHHMGVGKVCLTKTARIQSLNPKPKTPNPKSQNPVNPLRQLEAECSGAI